MDGERIKEIRPDGIVYRDDGGEQQLIDFSRCYENFVAKWTSPQSWEKYKKSNNKPGADFAEYVSRIKNAKEVGARQVLGPPWDDGPYIEFYTNPPIRFNFSSEEEYRQVRHAIEQTGWRTFDLS